MEAVPAWISSLPTVNALLNSSCAVLLMVGYRMIRARRIDAHRACMIGALSVSALFLTSYLVYHYHVGATPFGHEGEWIRPLYFTILLSHTVLAIAVTPMVLLTAYRALHADFARHRRIARWTLPIWLYVSVTGVVVYVMLYHLPGAAGR
jgi:uncharacterized membrane protein YozB (DUF420 family)